MSIIGLLSSRVAEGRLFILTPRAAGTSPKRLMLVAADLWKFLREPGSDDEWEDRKGFLLADLEVFADGAPIGPKYLFLLSPAREAVWEIRSVRPSPSIRVLGRFVAKDLFVATNFALRDQLGGWRSRQWRDARVKSRVVWNHLFHPYQPLVSRKIDDVVSGAIDGRYFKGA